MNQQNIEKEKYKVRFFNLAKNESDRTMDYFLVSFFAIGLVLAFFYDTWFVAIGVGGLSLLAYYSAKMAMPDSDLYQYVLGAVLGIFMAQYIYQMHGLFEMHFIAFIASAVLISYQNWKLQIPLALVVIVHHAVFGYLQFLGVDKVYFTQLEYMSLQTFIIHGSLATVIFLVCGFWAYRFRKNTERNIEQSFEIGRLGEEQLQRESLVTISKELKASNERLKEAQRIAHLGNWVWDIKANIVHRSDEVYRILDRTPRQMTGYEGFGECLHPDDKPLMQAAISQALKDHKPFSLEARIITGDNQIRITYSQAQVSVDKDGEVTSIHGIVQDITERKMAEQRITEAGIQLNNLFNTVDEGLFSVDMIAHKYINISKANERIYGYTAEEFFANPRLWNEVIHPDDRSATQKYQELVRQGKSIQHHFRIIHKDGSIRWLEAKATPTLNEAGRLIRIDGVVNDITEKKAAEAEIIALNASLEGKVKQRTGELEAANKELESFSYSVSHDLRAPLRVINGFSKLLVRKYGDKLDEDGKENLDAIMANAVHMGNLIDDLLSFSRLGRAELKKNTLDMNDMVRSAIDEVRSSDHNSAEIRLHDLKSAKADPVLLKQVWVNLLSNAAKYSRKREKPIIEIGTLGENGSTTYYVKDNGAGFDMEHYGKLFGVFQRLHKVTEYEGTGVGLALTQRIINRHGGKIWAEAKVNEGATFYFTLPAREAV